MASLVSPGVSVTITDESFFIPAASATVPLIFVATAEEKTQPGQDQRPAMGTFEHDVVRQVSSQAQLVELYGWPRFLEDSSGNAHNGDARNEYGLFAAYQFLQEGNRCYIVRANVNLNDDINDVRDMWDVKMQQASSVLENLITAYINQYNRANGLIVSSPGYKTTVTRSELISLAEQATVDIWDLYTFRNVRYDYFDSNLTPTTDTSGYQFVDLNAGATLAGATGLANDATVYTATIRVNDALDIALSVTGSAAQTFGDLNIIINAALGANATIAIDSGNLKVTSNATGPGSKISITNTGTFPLFSRLAGYRFLGTPITGEAADQNLKIYANGYSQPSTGDYFGFNGLAEDWVTSNSGSVVVGEWTPQEASNMLIEAANEFKYTVEFLNETSLGANDAARRVAIGTALQASINSNTEVLSEAYEFNLVLCPGWPETIDELKVLAKDKLKEEVFVVADLPMNLSPEDAAVWATNPVNRIFERCVAYYYPHCIESNLDGKNVMCAASGVALRTMAYSDNVSYQWFAPAGTRRGRAGSVTGTGYASGQLGGPTTFVQASLNEGQRDALYRDGVNVNPIVTFPARGVLVWGQKTSQTETSALNRVNVMRLMAYIKRQLRKNTMSFVFEPNDQLTRDNLKAAVDGFLSDLITKRALYDFATVCDESNNTPTRIDNNELWIDIALKPVKAAEFIYIPIRVVSTGAQI